MNIKSVGLVFLLLGLVLLLLSGVAGAEQWRRADGSVLFRGLCTSH